MRQRIWIVLIGITLGLAARYVVPPADSLPESQPEKNPASTGPETPSAAKPPVETK